LVLYRIWLDGFVLIDKGRTLDTVRKTVTDVAAEHPTCVVVDLTERSGGGPRRGDLWFTWESRGERFAALLALRVAKSEPRRVDWLLVSACARPWGAGFDSPIEVIGLADELDPKNHNGDSVGDPHVVPCHNINPPSLVDGFADKIAGIINDPDRRSGLLLLPQRDWPKRVDSAGLVTTLAVDDAERIAINARLHTRGMRKNQARLYLPARDGLPDVTAPTVPRAVAKDISIGIDQFLVARQSTALPECWQDDPAVQGWWSANPFDLPETAPSEPLVEEHTRIAQQLKEARRQIVILRQQKSSAEHSLGRALDENRLLREQLTGRTDPESLQVQLIAQQDELDRYIAAYDDLEAERDALRRRGGEVAAWRPRTDIQASPDFMDSEDEAADFASFADVLNAARLTLPGLAITADPAPAAALDNHPKAAVWRRKTWDSLRTLAAYVTARTSGTAPSVADILTFARTGQPGSLISANIIRLGESEAVNNNERCRAARVFPVEAATDASRRAYFAAHIALERFKPPAPRLHFLDDVANSGVVYVGYLGEHLPTLRTN
jgi:hypothetical protein